jgi:hypothetical protein
MKNAVALPFGFLLLAAVIAGCGSAQNAAATSAVPTPLPTPTTPCTSPPGYQIQMVFPQNGATSQPNLQGVVFAVAPSPLPTNWFVYGQSNYGSTYGTSSIDFLATAAPSATPFPTPSDTPLFTPALYESANFGTFANSALGASTFTIYLANPTCYPGLQESTFTTATTDQPTATPSPTST